MYINTPESKDNATIITNIGRAEYFPNANHRQEDKTN
jgi:hypothetical protein